MTKQKQWPRRAEEQRLDCIALALDGQTHVVALEQANLDGDRVEVARRNNEIFKIFKRIQELLIEAHQT